MHPVNVSVGLVSCCDVVSPIRVICNASTIFQSFECLKNVTIEEGESVNVSCGGVRYSANRKEFDRGVLEDCKDDDCKTIGVIGQFWFLNGLVSSHKNRRHHQIKVFNRTSTFVVNGTSTLVEDALYNYWIYKYVMQVPGTVENDGLKISCVLYGVDGPGIKTNTITVRVNPKPIKMTTPPRTAPSHVTPIATTSSSNKTELFYMMYMMCLFFSLCL